ncbi:MAG: hypothetical protein LBP60_04610 [Spirochaetaceae bacterium]|jgi:hypothetical protein|nr:hypothetical protein [Spirochaetaceae bacterium]
MAKEDRYTSPLTVFFLYLLVAFAGICAFCFIFPGQKEPLQAFKISWRFSSGIIIFIRIFPALAFSALVIPFGLKEHTEGGYAGTTYVGDKSFSPLFLKYFSWPVITASLSAAVYAVLFFLALPLTMNARAAMTDRSELYNRAKARAEAKSSDQEWEEASRFISICDRIWPGSEEIDKLKIAVTSALTASRQSLEKDTQTSANDQEHVPIWMGIPGNPVNSTDALRLAEAAFEQERYYDAHWLATLAQRLARPGNAEINAALTLAARAWEKIAALEPTAQEAERYSLYRMKRDAYEAMIAGDWIGAFYTFQDLASLTPDDPDVIKYLEASKNGIAQAAFFIDEMDLAIGNVQAGPVFSLPDPAGNGRFALRFSSLASLPDYAYAWGPELVAADKEGNFRFRVSADYAKLMPVASRDSEGNPSDRVVLLFRALDRTRKDKRWDPVWVEGPPAENFDPVVGASQLLFDLSYDDFILLSKIGQGIEGLNLRELYTAEKTFGTYGYVSDAFKVEILRRLADPLFFLPITILILTLGWRYRAQKKPRYVYVPMLGILPVIFYGILLFYRGILNNLSIWLSLNFSFSAVMIFLIAGSVVCFILSLVVLAAQHG